MWSTHICRSAGHHPRRNQVFPSTAGVLLMVALVTITLKVHKYWRHCQMFPTIIPILKSVRLRCNKKKKGSPRFQICLFYVDIELLCHMKSFYPKEDLLKRAGYPKEIRGHWQYNYISVQLTWGEGKKNFPNIVRTLEAGEDGSHWLDVV